MLPCCLHLQDSLSFPDLKKSQVCIGCCYGRLCVTLDVMIVLANWPVHCSGRQGLGKISLSALIWGEQLGQGGRKMETEMKPSEGVHLLSLHHRRCNALLCWYKIFTTPVNSLETGLDCLYKKLWSWVASRITWAWSYQFELLVDPQQRRHC